MFIITKNGNFVYNAYCIEKNSGFYYEGNIVGFSQLTGIPLLAYAFFNIPCNYAWYVDGEDVYESLW